MREQMDEDEMKKVIKFYPRTRQAALAAYELIDNKLCGDWQGQAKCPEKEADYYEKYAAEYPDGPRTAQALYQAVYRQAVLVDMFHADENDKKAEKRQSQGPRTCRADERQVRRSRTTRRERPLVQARPGNSGLRDRSAISEP